MGRPGNRKAPTEGPTGRPRRPTPLSFFAANRGPPLNLHPSDAMPDAREDAIYDDPALIPLYDVLNAANHDHDFYRREIPSWAERVIDLGCGTGRFARDLARRGFIVTAVDPAPGMIDFAKRQSGSDKVCWITGTAADLPQENAADAIIMMGHAFQCLLTDETTRDTFRQIRSSLRKGGRLLFESRNPSVSPWSDWNGKQRISLEGLGDDVEIERKVLAVDGAHVVFEEIFHLPGQEISSRSTLRFPDKAAIEEQLRSAGFSDIQVFGFWDRRPFAEDSPEIIVSAA